jgi:hypothetical protein
VVSDRLVFRPQLMPIAPAQRHDGARVPASILDGTSRLTRSPAPSDSGERGGQGGNGKGSFSGICAVSGGPTTIGKVDPPRSDQINDGQRLRRTALQGRRAYASPDGSTGSAQFCRLLLLATGERDRHVVANSGSRSPNPSTRWRRIIRPTHANPTSARWTTKASNATRNSSSVTVSRRLNKPCRMAATLASMTHRRHMLVSTAVVVQQPVDHR